MTVQKATPVEIERALYRNPGKRNYDGETQLVRSILDYLSTVVGIPAFRRNVGAAEYADSGRKRRVVRFGEPGQADIWFLAPGGLHGEIEAKKRHLGERSRPAPLQQAWLEDMQKAGAIALTVTSLEELAQQLESEFTLRGLAWPASWRLG
jgi:hypothetical protein